jgi:hypothetical protein
MSKLILCVDFDGVIHSYTSGWRGAAIIHDPPVPGALAWMRNASRMFNVVIYSTRSADPEGLAAMRMWLTYHARATLPESDAEALLDAVVFASEKPAAFLTIDDRAICFDGDWSKLDPEELLKFKPWYQRSSTPRIITEELTDNIDADAKSVTG